MLDRAQGRFKDKIRRMRFIGYIGTIVVLGDSDTSSLEDCIKIVER